MDLTLLILIFSSVSFIIYGLRCLGASRMKGEFQRYGLDGQRKLTGVLELAGAAGLLAGLHLPAIGLLASFGLTILMVLGFLVRMKIGDRFLEALPALVYAFINLYLTISFVPLVELS